MKNSEFNNSKRTGSVGVFYLYTFLGFILLYSIMNIEQLAGFVIDCGVSSQTQNLIETVYA